jgi:hypothetical protein
MKPPDYIKFYDLERYLFTEVGPNYVKTGKIDPNDFYMIIIWKANRAKTRVWSRLNKSNGGFASAVKCIASSLHASESHMRRLQILMDNWGFRLPIASAILTVLYPDAFSVYDARVCDQLGDFQKLADRNFSDELWANYQRFLSAVNAAVPGGLSLRDKDRYLWARSFYEGVEKDLATV